MPLGILRAFSVNKVEEFAKQKKSEKRKGPDKPIHTGVESLFTTESGFSNFRGLLNLGLILLIVSTLRTALENVNKYGIIMDPFMWTQVILSDKSQWPAISIITMLQAFILLAYMVECGMVRNWLGRNVGGLLIIANLIVTLVYPTVVIWTNDINPVFGAPVLMLATIVFLKLWSYAMVNYWCRQHSHQNRPHRHRKGSHETPSVSSTTQESSSLNSSNSSLSEAAAVVAANTRLNRIPSSGLEDTEKASVKKATNDEEPDWRGHRERERVRSHGRFADEGEQAKDSHRRTKSVHGEKMSFQLGDYEVTVKNPYRKFNSCCGTNPFADWDGSLASLKTKRQSTGTLLSRMDKADNPNLYAIPTIVHCNDVAYPANLTVGDIYFFMFAPTLCYELNFPRTLTIRKEFLLKRLAELIFLPQLIICLVQQWILPILESDRQQFVKTKSWTVLLERLLRFAIPNHILWLIGFYVAFHSALNVLAEAMRFGDRLFYKDWWNAESIGSFWSTWNMPVHRWCRRHVYFPLLEQGLSRTAAGFVVFFISAVLHEFLASVPLKMVRMWAFLGMFFQMPYAYLVQTFCPQGGKMGNVAVWLSLIIGQPLAILMYAHDYYLQHYPLKN